ncbi:alpha/beta hydrolase family protein, partial [Chloroflexota bacterium]
MKHTSTICIAVCIILLSACGTSTVTLTSVSSTTMPSITQSATPEPTATLESIGFPLSESGSYHVGIRRNIAFEDSSRDGRKVTITIWYPAVQPQESTSSDPISDAMPDLTNAPYPLILSSSKVGSIFASHLASYGFVYVGINGQDSKAHWGQWLTDYPLDIVFVLNQIASNPLIGLENMIDTNHAGAMGYSFDGYTSLALSGARVNPEFYITQCKNATALNPAPPVWWIDYICNPTDGWNEL